MSKKPDIDPEILEPEPAYNDPTLSPQDFLLAVMRNPRLPMSARIDAASKVSVYVHPRLAQITQEVSAGLTIKIEGGLPALPGTNIIMPDRASESSDAPPTIPSRKGGNGHDTD